MCYKPYPICVGKKDRHIPKLRRPLIFIFKITLCNCLLLNKEIYKPRVLQQIIRGFYKDSLGFRVNAFFKNGDKCKIENNDFIHLVCHTSKSVLAKLLLKLNYKIHDYKLLKNRRYTLGFTFFFTGCEKEPNKLVTLDIEANENEMIRFFFVTDLYYAKDFIQLLFFYHLDECHKLVRDEIEEEETETETEE